MIRISTTALVVGDHIIASSHGEGIVTWMPKNREDRFWVEIDGTPVHMRDCGSVELLSDLGDRKACEPFGRW
jgi:hypothetical protein